MAKTTPVTIELTMEDEFELMNKYGRRCSREGLIYRAIADAVKGTAAPAKADKPKKERKKKSDAPTLLDGVDDPERSFNAGDVVTNHD
jgi:hypothetical protein